MGEGELTALAEVVATRGGTLAAHIRYEDAGRAEGYAEMGRIGARTGIRVVIAHERLDAVAAPAFARIRALADVTVETYGYRASSTTLAICLPEAARAGGPDALTERLRRPADRARVAAMLDARLESDRRAGDRIVIAASADPGRIGGDLHDLAARAGRSVGAYAADQLADDPSALYVFHHDGRLDHEQVAQRTFADRDAIVASDGIYVDGQMHPRGFGTFPRMLRVMVRETGTLPLEEAIHAMTGRPAARYRVPDRGTIRLGAIADLVILDPDTVADGATWEEPRRPPVGIDAVIVGGVPVVQSGVVAADRPGRVLRAG